MKTKVIGKGHMMETVIDMGNGTVTKTPRNPWITSVEAERESLKRHQDLNNILVPDWEIREIHWGFQYHQEKVEGKAVNLLTDITKEELIAIIEDCEHLKSQNMLLDLFGIQWLMNLFKHYENGTFLWNFTDLCSDLRINSAYLKLRHKLPMDEFTEMRYNDTNKFVAHNLLRNEEWKLVLVDTDNRPTWFPNLLNSQWERMTRIALDDLLEKHQNDDKNSST